VAVDKISVAAAIADSKPFNAVDSNKPPLNNKAMVHRRLRPRCPFYEGLVSVSVPGVIQDKLVLRNKGVSDVAGAINKWRRTDHYGKM